MTSERRPRVAYVLSHPIQYQAPLLRHLVQEAGIDLHVWYLSDYSAREHLDPQLGVDVAWDVPLLDGYPCEAVSHVDGVKPWRPIAPGLGRRIVQGGFDALWIHGWNQLGMLRAAQIATRAGVPLLLRGE